MKQGLTPYMLALGPIAMFIGFSLWPGGGTDDSFLLGDAYLEDVKNVDMNMLYLSILITATGILMIFGWSIRNWWMLRKRFYIFRYCKHKRNA